MARPIDLWVENNALVKKGVFRKRRVEPVRWHEAPDRFWVRIEDS
jgi:hypothetical protein